MNAGIGWEEEDDEGVITKGVGEGGGEGRIVRMTKKDRFGRDYQIDVHTTLAQLNARYSNVRVTGEPVQCDPDLCEYLRAKGGAVGKASLEEMAENRFVMDVDGNS